MSKLSEQLDKWYKKYIEDEDDKHRISHSPSYHQFFQGYSEERRLKSDGTGYKIDRIYTGYYLSLKGDRRHWIMYKILYLILFLISAALTAVTLFLGAAYTETAWVVVFGVLQLLMLVMMLIPLGNYICAKRLMKLGDFHISAERLQLYSLIASVLALTYLILTAMFYVFHRDTLNQRGILSFTLQLVSTAAISAIYILERNARYQRIDNQNKTPYNANEIW